MSEKLILNSRKYLRSSVTKLFNSVGSFGSLPSSEKKLRRLKLLDLQSELKTMNRDYQNAKFAGDSEINEIVLKDEMEKCEHYDDIINKCLVALEEEIVPHTSGNVAAPRSLLKCPVVPLPKFMSEPGEDFTRFLLQFNQALSKYSLSQYDKFILLKEQMKGRALLLIESLESDKQSFDEAVKILKEALASPVTQRYNILTQLLNMKLVQGGEPYSYICQMKNITETIKDLKVTIDHVLAFFFWKGLNSEFQFHVTSITNKIKPDLEELNSAFFEATERYLNALGNNNVKPKLLIDNVDSFATKVETNIKAKSFKCSLCSADGKVDTHATFQCKTYVDSTSKLDKLKSIGGCMKCANTKHKTSACRYKFKKKCIFCKRWHFSFLCNQGNSESKNVNKKPETNFKKQKGVENNNIESSSNPVCISDAFTNTNEGRSILPTFSCNIDNKVTVRAMKDQCAQSNFICTDLAENLNLKVIHDNVMLNVNGFNSIQGYQTKIVEVNIDFGNRFRKVNALCIPNIKVNLNLPGLREIATTFKSKGYKLADQELSESDSIDNVKFMLGANSAHCLKSFETSFGNQNDSIFINCDLGIMPIGDVNVILESIKSLPESNLSNNSNSNHRYAGPSQTETFIKTDVNSVCMDTTGRSGVETVETSAYFIAMDEDRNLAHSELGKAVQQILNYDQNISYDKTTSEVNQRLVDFVIKNTSRLNSGRLCMPLIWRTEVSHLLGSNLELSKSILASNLNKLKKKPEYLKMMDEVFKAQEELGIIERVENIDQYMVDYPNHSFLAHMGVFRPSKDTTKCRVVYLSNLVQKDYNKKLTVSHNQAIHSGPCINQKITTAMLQLRFDSHVLIYDLKKAFNQIALSDLDSSRLLCIWYRNVAKQDFSLVYFRNRRLPFGLRCSPTLLMLSLHKILILDVANDSEDIINFKKLLYANIYMDNGAYSVNNLSELRDKYEKLNGIFFPYGFEIQQCVCNDTKFQTEIDNKTDISTPQEVGLLGCMWDRINDTISTRPISLNDKASSKRETLKSIASNFDMFNINGPLMNRARLFVHRLQCDKNLEWDDKLSDDRLKEWKNICNQTNAAPPLKLNRFIGKRTDSYSLIACTDASKDIIGVTLYSHNNLTGQNSFILAKNRLVGTDLRGKSIPCLELQAIVLGVTCLMDLYNDLSSKSNVVPVDITDLTLLTDSLVCLAWLNDYTKSYSNMNKKSVFVLNRLEEIRRLCDKHLVCFKFIAGIENPADKITRPVSYKILEKTNYLTGPKIDLLRNSQDDMQVLIPNSLENNVCFITTASVVKDTECVIDINKYSSFSRMLGIVGKIFQFVYKLKSGVNKRKNNFFRNFTCGDNFIEEATLHLVACDQHKYFKEIFNYFTMNSKSFKDMPFLVQQLNVFVDDRGLLRVRNKLDRLAQSSGFCGFPLLLAKSSQLTKAIILNLHIKMLHAGCYSLLVQFRKSFWVPRGFSTVKQALKSCVLCRRYNGNTIKINQSPYREFRMNPSSIPYRSMALDFMGPFEVWVGGERMKIYILCLSCLWTRSINLKICKDLTVRCYLRAFQLHVYQWGMPSFVMSDHGSQLVAGNNMIHQFLKDPDTDHYFKSNGISNIEFSHYVKGRNELGGIIESCVKLVKRLLFSSIGKNILSYDDFEHLVSLTNNLVNKRPISFKESLRDFSGESCPEPITPEILTYGFELHSVNIIPQLQRDPYSDMDPEWGAQSTDSIRSAYEQLKKVRSKLIDIYYTEFITKLADQAVDKKSRYRLCTHKPLKPKDIVLIKETFMKPLNYPMAIVREINKNDLGEVTDVVLLKGGTREIVKRHVQCLIPYLDYDDQSNDSEIIPNSDLPNNDYPKLRPHRAAAAKAKDRIKNMSLNN